MEKYLINPNQKISTINKDIYGHFAEHLGRCIYDGIFVGKESKIPNVNGMRKDVVAALKEMGIPVLRWPGGCFADEYHWKDGIGPAENRKKMINTHWGGVVEDNSFGTHEYFELCRQLGCDTYINGNVGSGTVAEMSEWVEYMTFDGVSPMAQLRRKNGQDKPWKVKYFGVGNESWGCGGNMDPEYYGDLYKRYNTYVRNYDGCDKIKRVACGPNGDDYHWTKEVMEKVKHNADCIALHYYTVVGDNWENKGSATEFNTNEYYRAVCKAYKMEELIRNHLAVMDAVNPQRWVQLIIDEWGTWYDVEPGTNPGFLYQQNSMRDALIAGINLNLFNNHSERVRMANLAQAINVLQSLVLTDNEKMILTPTYYIFKMYKVHHDANWLQSTVTCSDYAFGDKTIPSISVSSSKDANGKVHVSITNIDPHNAISTSVFLNGIDVANASGQIITSSNYTDCNTFDNPNKIGIKPFNDFKVSKGSIVLNMPPLSVITIEIE